MMTKSKEKSGYCTVTAVRYAKVLYELGISKEEIEESRQIFKQSPELLQILENPVVTKEKKHILIDRICSGETGKMRNFLKVVTDYGKIGIIQEIFQAYGEQEDRMAGIVTARLLYVTAPLEEQLAKMEVFVRNKFGAKDVRWDMQERPELMGGFILSVNGTEYDYSMQGRLKRLEQKLTWR